MAPVARPLARTRGIIEPLQTRDSLDGQVEELRTTIIQHGAPPVTMVGSSWGAMLSLITAARHPDLAAKIIMVGSGVFQDQYAAGIMETRLNRLSREDRDQTARLLDSLNRPETPDKDLLLTRLGALMTKADAYDPFFLESEDMKAQYEVHVRVWEEAARLRAAGGFLELGRRIQCPVLAIHGDYDPHPADGVKEPLSAVIKDFRFHVLKNCGHLPWLEKQAAAPFFALLESELTD